MKIILLNNAIDTHSTNTLNHAKLMSIFNDMTNAVTCTDVFSLFTRFLFDNNNCLESACKSFFIYKIEQAKNRSKNSFLIF